MIFRPGKMSVNFGNFPEMGILLGEYSEYNGITTKDDDRSTYLQRKKILKNVPENKWINKSSRLKCYAVLSDEDIVCCVICCSIIEECPTTVEGNLIQQQKLFHLYTLRHY